MKHLVVPALFSWLLATPVLAASPVAVVSKASLGKADAHVLFQGDDYALVRATDAKAQDFSDLYWVNLGGASLAKADLGRFGEVLNAVDGKFAVVRMSEAQADAVAGMQHDQGLACGGLFRLFGDAVPADAAAKADPRPLRATDDDIAAVHELVGEVKADNIRATVEELSSIFTRYHTSSTGLEVAAGLAQKYQALAKGRADVTVGTYAHGSRTRQNSLHVTIRGKTRPDEIVVLGSHIDSTAGWGGSSRAPGADDNASGTATNLELFRVIMEKGLSFDRTIEIHGYAAEEIGLVGSQDMAQRYKSEGKNVVAMFQIDMDIYRDGAEDKIWLVSNNTNAALNGDLAAYIDRYVGVARGSASLSGGSSDHASWNRQGYAAAFPFENPRNYNGNIHTGNDTIANAGAFSQAAAFAKLGLGYLAHYAGLAE